MTRCSMLFRVRVVSVDDVGATCLACGSMVHADDVAAFVVAGVVVVVVGCCCCRLADVQAELPVRRVNTGVFWLLCVLVSSGVLSDSVASIVGVVVVVVVGDAFVADDAA